MRVLIIEDNRLNMELVTDLLQAAGHVVLQATTGEAGVERARADAPDVVLMDIRLPGMNGMEAMAILKRDGRTARIPTVALTAQAMQGDAEAALAAGFDGYLMKPIDTRRFVDEVCRFASRGEGE